MANQYISIRNLQFMLHEVLHATTLNQYAYYADYDAEAFNMVLDAAKQIGDTYLYPIYRDMDKNKAYYKDGVVHVHPKLREALKAIAEGGWIAAHDSYENGGQQMPFTLMNCGVMTFYAANGNAASHAFLSTGAANLIRTFANAELNEKYVPNLYNGDWQGTMALTEPQAGSSLMDITTSAEPLDGNGTYKIKGQKIYISGGDHNAVDNVVHLLLAKIKGAPAGTKGISLFVVPKYRLENGELVYNDVTTAGIYGKMGQKGYVAAHLMLGEKDNCIGYLVGKEHQGLPYMFQMMNEARIGTGMMAAGAASAAYYASLQYANERSQGRHPSNKDPLAPPVLIIEHADVRRMLLQQKAIVEGSIALLLQCSYYADLSKVAEGEEKENAHLLLELLTPIAKSYPAEMGTYATSVGMQVLGGAGYTDDFPLEQYYRDIRVNAIYEGTTTIHGLDLLGRKVMMQNGKAAMLYATEIQKTIMAAQGSAELKPLADQLAKAATQLQEVTAHLLQLATQEKPETFLADATLYLELFATVTIAWQWLQQAIAAEKGLADAAGDAVHFYKSKLHTAR
ncbi:MAG: acyl-CoA dehydrogenase, partial [Saprospiraceae bacterium]